MVYIDEIDISLQFYQNNQVRQKEKRERDEKWPDRPTDRHTYRTKRGRATERQTDRQTDRQIDGQKDRPRR